MSFLLKMFLSDSGQTLQSFRGTSETSKNLRKQFALCHPAFISWRSKHLTCQITSVDIGNSKQKIRDATRSHMVSGVLFGGLVLRP